MSKEESKASFKRNYKNYLFLANTKSSRRDKILLERKGQFYSKNVVEQISKVEKFQFPTLILLLGIVSTIHLSLISFEGGNLVLNDSYSNDELIKTCIDIGIWLIVYYFVVNPLIYFAKLPKPLEIYIKNITDLSEEEKKKIITDFNDDERTKKILSRYSFSGMASYDDDGNRTDKIGRN